MMALVVVLMKIYKQRVLVEDSSSEASEILSNPTDRQVQEAMSEVVHEAVTDRWDRRTFAVTSENPEGGDRVRLTVYTECGITGNDCKAAVGELRASGRHRRSYEYRGLTDPAVANVDRSFQEAETGMARLGGDRSPRSSGRRPSFPGPGDWTRRGDLACPETSARARRR